MEYYIYVMARLNAWPGTDFFVPFSRFLTRVKFRKKRLYGMDRTWHGTIFCPIKTLIFWNWPGLGKFFDPGQVLEISKKKFSLVYW